MPEDSAILRALRLAGMSAGVTGSYVGYLAQRAFVGEKERNKKLRAAHAKVGRKIQKGLGALRGPAMKLGQLLSLQTDLLPKETLAELCKLQMSAPPMHPSLVRAQIRASFGRDPEEVFRSFDYSPIAAASLGQVHRAEIQEREPVAVKVQYPGIAEAIKNDFRLLRVVAGPANLSRHVSPAVLTELEHQISAEADYEKEAANAEFFRDQLQQFTFVEVPRIYRKYSTDKVLTMSWVAGEHLDLFLESKPSQRLRDLVGERLLELFCFQLLRMGAFHADPHWGNYLLRRDGSIGMIDFGCVKFLPQKFVQNLRRMFLYPGKPDSAEFRALLDERYSLLGQKLSAKTKNAIVGLTEKFYNRVYPPDPATDDQAFDFSETKYLSEFLSQGANVWRAKGALPEYVFLARAEAGLYQTLHRLGARVHTSRIVRRYVAG